MQVSVIIPLFNEIERLPNLYQHLQQFDFAEIIFIDGGSDDGSWQWLQKNSTAKNIQSEAGRALQMNAGAKQAKGNLLLFLHADSYLPVNAVSELTELSKQGCQWGRFDIAFIEQDWRMQIVAFLINLRSRLSLIATGDQAIFVSAELFGKTGAFAQIPIMEDVQLCKQLKKYGRPYCSRAKVQTSARRWLSNGVFKTVLQMWWFRFAYFIGVSPEKLSAYYKNIR